MSNLGISKAIYIGHDWGSIIVQRVTLWYPDHVIALGVVCVGLLKPNAKFVPLDDMVKVYPNFAYQIYFASHQAEKELSTPDAIERFLKAIFRVKGDGPVKWNTGNDMLTKMGNPSLGKLWENQTVWQYYVRMFQKTGSLRGPLNYYKTRGLNYKDELELIDRAQIKCPTIFIGALADVALPPTTWRGQGWVPQLERHSVNGGHWCLVEGEGKEIAPIIQSWVMKISKTSRL
jgi:pimeloyl-ACP methyl ester carboxylesterase